MAKFYDMDCKDNVISVVKNDNGMISEFVYDPTLDDMIPKKNLTRKDAVEAAKGLGCSDEKIAKFQAWLRR
jgi:hypothetical protein